VKHRVARSGTWLYDGSVPRPVHIVELDYDFWYEIAKADGMVEPGEKPDLNPQGLRYYVCFREVPRQAPIWVDSPGHYSIGQACEHAQSKVPSPISWQ
jgi:hypothetical protein